MGTIKERISGDYTNVKQTWEKVSGTWVKHKTVWEKVSGTWVKVWQAVTSYLLVKASSGGHAQKRDTNGNIINTSPSAWDDILATNPDGYLFSIRQRYLDKYTADLQSLIWSTEYYSGTNYSANAIYPTSSKGIVIIMSRSYATTGYLVCISESGIAGSLRSTGHTYSSFNGYSLATDSNGHAYCILGSFSEGPSSYYFQKRSSNTGSLIIELLSSSYSPSVARLAFAKDGKLYRSHDRAMNEINPDSGTFIRSASVSSSAISGYIRSMAISSDNIAFLGTSDGKLLGVDLTTLTRIFVVNVGDTEEGIYNVEVDVDGNCYAICQYDTVLRKYNKNGTLLLDIDLGTSLNNRNGMAIGPGKIGTFPEYY
ncbi:MAG: hypothetical protein ACOWWO_12120 [Peptococcaceae bacterium]